MTVRIQMALVLVAALILTLVAFASAPQPAYADRCQPEELVTGRESPIPEKYSPVCMVLYPCEFVLEPGVCEAIDP